MTARRVDRGQRVVVVGDLTARSKEPLVTMNSLDDLPVTISVDAAQILGISRRSAYRAAASGELPAVRLGRRLRVPSAALRQLLSGPWGQSAADRTDGGSTR